MQHLLQPLWYWICAGIISVFFVLALAFLAAFGTPSVLAKNVLAGADIFFWVYGYIWITGTVCVCLQYFCPEKGEQ